MSERQCRRDVPRPVAARTVKAACTGALATLAGAVAVLLCACGSPSRAAQESGTEPASRAEPQPLVPSSAGPAPGAPAGSDEPRSTSAAAGASPDSEAAAPEPPSGFANEGQCTFEGSGVFRDGAYAGTLAFVLFAEPFGDEELCRVSFELATVANADPECDFCFFSTVVQLSNPVQVVNVDGLCENSERALRPAAIEAMLAAPVAIGFAEEATGHGQVLVEYDAERMRWAEVTFGSFEPATGMLSYSKNEGFCRY